MSTYLLLRNNKESGPYSANDLKALGLKPYDLVWLNGKSAAWRYPSEIEELKSFAPISEEQPYDRFYKKPSGQESKVIDTVDQNLVKENKGNPDNSNVEEVKKVIAEPVKAAPDGKKIYVSLPQNGQPVKNHEPVMKVEKNTQEIPVQFANYLPEDVSHTTDEVPELATKYSQPLDEIKDMYVQTLLDRKKKIARKSFAKKNLKKVSVFVAVLIAGVVLGLAFQNKTRKDVQDVSQKVQSTPINSPDVNLNNPDIVSEKEDQSLAKEDGAVITEPESQPRRLQDKIEKDNTFISLKQQQRPVLKRDAGKNPEKENITILREENKMEPVADVPVKNDPVTGERKKAVRSDNDIEPVSTSSKPVAPRFSAKDNFLKQLSLKASDYKTGPFGGIRDLNLTLINNSQSQIEEVEVEVKYIGIEKTVVKTQKMIFHDIPPRGQIRSEVPRTNRGISVECVITKINSKESGLVQTDF